MMRAEPRLFICAAASAEVAVFTPGAHELLRLDAERIGDPIDVVEEAYDLSGVMNGDIIQASRSQPRHIRLAHLGGRKGQFLGVGA